MFAEVFFLEGGRQGIWSEVAWKKAKPHGAKPRPRWKSVERAAKFTVPGFDFSNQWSQIAEEATPNLLEVEGK